MRLILAALAGMLLLPAQDEPNWVRRSDENTQIVIELLTKYRPERASEFSVRGLDEEISAPSIDQPERFRHDAAGAREELERRRTTESDPDVSEDLEILIAEVDFNVRTSDVNQRILLPYDNAADIVFYGLTPLLQEEASPARHQEAVVRLRRYAGMEDGYRPITLLSEQVFTAALARNPALLGPMKEAVDNDLAGINGRADEIQRLMTALRLTGWQEAFARLKTQLAQYQDFLRTTVLPKCRTDFHLPPELYALSLARAGVNDPIDQVVRLAHQQFGEIQTSMQPIGARIAKQRGWPAGDYREVLRRLHQEQLNADTIEPLYRQRIAELDQIIGKQNLLTLPALPPIVRMATAQQTEGLPVPRTIPPPLLNNRRERAQFILPLETKGVTLRFDDYNAVAAAWTISSHEVRPGHELQYQFMLDHGVSLARGLFAVNSVNIEGWAMYSEWLMFPYMPDDAKLLSLQFRLMRTARAFLDPEVQQGKIAPADALRVLRDDVVLSDVLAKEDVERYQAMAGHSVSYFDGLTRMLAIRHDAGNALGARFRVQAFNDFILAQGLLPLDLLRTAVMTRFVPTQR